MNWDLFDIYIWSWIFFFKPEFISLLVGIPLFYWLVIACYNHEGSSIAGLLRINIALLKGNTFSLQPTSVP